MMTILKNKIEHATLSLSDIHVSLRSVTTYAWMTAGVFFILYLYLVGAITFAVVKQESLAESMRTIVSQTGGEEQTYLTLQKGLTETYALQKGFVPAQSAQAITYATASRSNFAWNIAR